jgi:hypothetical protein
VFYFRSKQKQSLYGRLISMGKAATFCSARDSPHPTGLHRTRGETTKPMERSHVATRDRLRGPRALQTTATGQRFLNSFEGLQALRRGHVKWPILIPSYRSMKASPHETTRAGIVYFKRP